MVRLKPRPQFHIVLRGAWPSFGHAHNPTQCQTTPTHPQKHRPVLSPAHSPAHIWACKVGGGVKPRSNLGHAPSRPRPLQATPPHLPGGASWRGPGRGWEGKNLGGGGVRVSPNSPPKNPKFNRKFRNSHRNPPKFTPTKRNSPKSLKIRTEKTQNSSPRTKIHPKSPNHPT